MNRLQFFLGVQGFGLVNMIATMIVISTLLPEGPGGGYLATPQFYSIFYMTQAPAIFSSTSLAARRAHDLGASALPLLAFPAYVLVLWMLFAIWPALEDSLGGALLLLAGALVTLVLFLRPGEVGANRFGPAPPPGWLPA